MTYTVNPSSQYFVVYRPDTSGDVVAKYDKPGDVEVEIGNESDTESDLEVVELSSFDELEDYTIDVKEDWFWQ